MLKPKLKTKVKELWNRLWTGGIANSLAAIEQISYLIFLKRLEELDHEQLQLAAEQGHSLVSRFQDHPECRWSYIRQQDPVRMVELIKDRAFPFLKNLSARDDVFAIAMHDARFIIPTASLLRDAMEIIDTLPIMDGDFDTQGDLYEEFLEELSLAGRNGQFRTPRHIVRTMVELVDPRIGEWICDPAAGTAGFLIGAYQWILKSFTPPDVVRTDEDGSWHHLTAEALGEDAKQRRLLDGERFVGFDFDMTMVRLGSMNMMLHGISHPALQYQNTLSRAFHPDRAFDVILSSPPFGSSLDRDALKNELLTLKTGKTELLFLELCLRLLSEGGRCAIIVPEGVLFGSTNAHRQLRHELIEQNSVEAVISLPGGCFQPYTGVKTAILLFRRGGSTENVWFYEVTADGYTPDSRRIEDPVNNDLRYVPQAFRIDVRKTGEAWASSQAEEVAARRSWTVGRKEISQGDYSLAPGTYRPALAASSGERPDPMAIIARIQVMETEIASGLSRLDKMIRGARDA